MRNIRLLFLSAMAVLAIGCTRSLPDPAPVEAEEAEGSDICTIPGILHVEFTEEMTSHIESSQEDELIAELGSYGITSLTRLFPDAGEFEARHRESGLHHWYKVSYDPTTSATKAAASFRDIPGAATVEIPRKIHTTARYPFSDPYAGEQWNLYNTSQVSGFVKGIDINVLPLWEITGGSSDVIVNVVDTGVDMNHEELQGVCIPASGNGSHNFVYGREGSSITPGMHGTHVAGTIAAISNNGKGISGIAGGLNGRGGVRILNSQIFHEREDGKEDPGDSEAAIIWGADHGALISQNSWGYDYNSEREAKESTVPKEFKAAVDYFIKYAGCDADGNQTGLMKGGLVVFAAGNDGWSAGHPGDYEPVVCVGALGPDGRRATYSNYGNWVDICAPGGETDRFSDPIAMILAPAGGSYYYMTGTSMACPHVSGVAALLISAYGGPGFTCDDLKKMLLDGANPAVGASEKIGPMLDAYGAYLAYGGTAKPRIRTDYTGDYRVKGHEVLSINFYVTSETDVKIDVECDNAATYSIHDKDIAVTVNDGSGKLTGIHRLKITATDTLGQTATETFDFTILQNHAPVVVSPVEDKVVSIRNSTITVNLENVFKDEDGGTLTYKASVSGNNAFEATESRGSLNLTSIADGIAEITLTATDPCGLSCSCSFKAGMFDGSNGPSLYPNPVVDFLNVCPAGITETKVTIYNSAGRKLFSGHGKASILDPYSIDMTGYAPGQYRIDVSYGGNSYNKTIVKK